MSTGSFVAVAFPDLGVVGGLGFSIGSLVLGGIVGASLGSAIALLPFLGLHDAVFVSV